MGGIQFALELLLLALEQSGRNRLLIEAHLHELVLAGFELGDQDGLGPLDLVECALADLGQSVDSGLAALQAGGWQLDGGVVALDGSLDQFRANVGPSRTGRAVDPAATEEVRVLAAVASGRDAERQPSAALAAEDAAPQVVLAHSRPLSGNSLLVKQDLHAVKGVLVDQRFMAALEDLFVRGAALVDELADVVRVAQQPLHGGGAERTGRAGGGRSGAQAQVVQLASKLGDRVFAAGVELEGCRNERAALRVKTDDGNSSAVRQFIDAVEVAETSRAVGAADAGLLLETALDALAGLHRLELVLSGDHALVEEGGGAVVADHRLGDGDQLGPGVAHQLAGLPVVALVARPARQAPDDDVLDAGRSVFVAALQLIEHGQEARPLMQINEGRAAGVAVLTDNPGLKLDGLFLGSLALSVDTQAVVAVVGADLALGGHTQIGKGPRRRFGYGDGRIGEWSCRHLTSFLP
ncbi:MAG TPA: hypothetical protein VN889_04115 [Solirubrobacteraceae bacterium]|nr:hypothetical protein [Solirubrobacteraceae bacterium]